MIRNSLEDAIRQREDFNRLEAELARWTYKPGWTFELERPPPHDSFAVGSIVVRYQALDSRGSGETIPIVVRWAVDVYLLQDEHEQVFQRWLQARVLDAERHESREWLRRDGGIFDDPHAERRR